MRSWVEMSAGVTDLESTSSATMSRSGAPDSLSWSMVVIWRSAAMLIANSVVSNDQNLWMVFGGVT